MMHRLNFSFKALSFILLVGLMIFHTQQICGQNENSFNGVPMDKLMEMRNYYMWVSDYASQKEFDSSGRYSKRAMDLARSLKNDEMMGYAKICHARNLYYQRDIEEAKALMQENTWSSGLHDSIKVRSYFLLGEIHQYEKDYVKGISVNIDAEKLLRKSKTLRRWDSLSLSLVYTNIANLYKEINEYNKAHDYFDQAREYNVVQGMDSYILYYRSELYEEEDKIHKAIDYTHEALKRVTDDKRELFLPTYYLALSRYYHKLKIGDSAIYYGLKGLKDNSYCQLDLLHNALGNAYMLLQDFPKAQQFYKNALSESTSNAVDTIVHKNLSDVYQRMGDYKNALTHNNHYLKLKDSLDGLKVKQEIAMITEKYESGKKQLEIEKLNVEKAESESVIKEQKAKLTLISITLLGLLLLLSIIYYFYVKQRKQKHLLYLKNSELARELRERQSITLRRQSKEDTGRMQDAQRLKIQEAIESQMKEGFYLDTDMTLAKMAKLIETNTTYLSKVINEDYEKSFATFLNELRLSYTLENLESEPNFRKLTIDHIAEKSGFASSSTFYNAFKKYTGLTPSYYIKKRLVQGE